MDNRTYIRHSLLLADLPPIDLADPVAVEQRAWEYLNYCLECDLVPGVQGLCLALGCTRRTFTGWANGSHRSATHTAFAQKFKTCIEAITVSRMLEGKLPPTIAIFWLKVHHGYRDQSELVIEKSNETVLEDPQTLEEIRKRYLQDN